MSKNSERRSAGGDFFKQVFLSDRAHFPIQATHLSEEIAVVERGNESAVQLVWLLAHDKEPPLLVDVCFAWIISPAHRGIVRPVSP